MKFSKIAALAGSLLMASNAVAEHQDSRWHITPMAGYIWADEDRGTDFDGAVGQINIGNALNEKVDLDFRLQYLDLGNTTEQVGAGIELTWFKSRTATITPLFVVGAGWLNNEITGNPGADDSIVLDAGLGLQARLTDNGISLRGDVRQRLDFNDIGNDDFSDTIAMVGLVFPLGKIPTEAEMVAVVTDSDNDGVADTKDACPATPAGVHVDSAGCPLDSDKDGVADGADLCPNTAKGAAVDVNGCPKKVAADKPQLVSVYFDFDSAELSEAAKAKLQVIADQMVERKYIVAVSTGYTDTMGSAEYNLGLSRKRANAVKGYLIERGVRTANIIAKGVGEADPAVSNETKAGRQQNRRVEVRLLDQ